MPIISGILLERTNIRSTPAGDEVIGSIVKDANITATDTGGQWLLLQTVNGVPKGGWINTRYVRIVASPPPPPPPPTKTIPFTLTVEGYKPASGYLEPL